MEGNRAERDPDPPRDLNIQRYRDDRTPVHAPYVNINDFSNAILIVFTRAMAMNASTGHKDRGCRNMDRTLQLQTALGAARC